MRQFSGKVHRRIEESRNTKAGTIQLTSETEDDLVAYMQRTAKLEEQVENIRILQTPKTATKMEK